MPKKKVSVKKKVVSSKASSIVPQKKADKCCSSWIWWVLGALILLAALFFLYKGMTGNVITGYAGADVSNAFEPIVQMVSGLITSIYEVLKTPLSYLVGATADVSADPTLSANIFLAKVLLLILVLSLVSSILKSSGVSLLQEGAPHWIVSIIVAILSVRFLTPDMIQTILIPYSTFGVAITAVLPFILYFFFVEKTWGAPKSPVFRRTAWIFFAVVFLAIWIMRYEDLSAQGGIVSTIYPLTALIAVIMCFIDGTIQSWFNAAKVGRAKAGYKGAAVMTVQKKMNDIASIYNGAAGGSGYPGGIHTSASAGKTGTDAYLADMDFLEKELRRLLK